MIKKIFLSTFLTLLVVPFLAQGATFRSDELVGAQEVVSDNLYLFGRAPVINGNIQGDLVAAGGTVIASGEVRDDVLAAGGTVNVTGSVGGDLRVAGGNVLIDGNVNGDVVACGGEVRIGPQAIIQGDLVVSGGKVVVDPQATIRGKVSVFQGPTEKETKPETMWDQYRNVEFYLGKLWGFLSALTAAAVLFALTRKTMPILLEKAFEKGNFWKSIGLGLIVLLLTPIVAVLCFVTGVGVLLGFLLIFSYIVYLLFAFVFSGILLGGLLFKLFKKNNNKKAQFGWGWMILGVVLLHIIGFVPVIGGTVIFVFMILALGAMPMAKIEILERI